MFLRWRVHSAEVVDELLRAAQVYGPVWVVWQSNGSAEVDWSIAKVWESVAGSDIRFAFAFLTVVRVSERDLSPESTGLVIWPLTENKNKNLTV